MSTDSPDGDSGDPRFTEFLADYFVECDEHLSVSRRSLLALEPQLSQPTVDRGLLDELFRSFHSLKGLSAMVGFGEAEQLAHHLETYLGAVRRNQTRLNLAGLEGLMEGVAGLEKIIAARRDGSTPPDVGRLPERLAALLPASAPLPSSQAAADPAPNPPPTTGPTASPPSSAGDTEALIARRLRDGGRAWRFTFAPSRELVDRGIDVNAVRKKLQTAGEIAHSAPLIGAAGQIEFSFILVSELPAEAVLALEGDGLRGAAYRLAPGAAPDRSGAPDRITPDRITPNDGPVPTETDAEPAERAAGEGPSTHLTPANIVRVDLERLDDLMRLVGELVLSRARLDDGLRRLGASTAVAHVRSLRETSSVIERQLRDLREGVMRVRMVPVREVFARMQFVVRDLLRESGQRVTLRLDGEETQIDKYVVERIMDPLLHLVRNAVGHGLESPDRRQAAGKPAEGRLRLSAHTTGETVVIEVEDDGRGIDVDDVFAQARRRGMIPAQATADEISLLDVLCIPGFSTRDRSDRVSGRGIGMDVVRTAVEELGGDLALDTSPGRGTRFTIRLPLTLAITDALIVAVGPEKYALPQVAVREIIRVDDGASTQIENNELLRYRDGALPLVRLSRLFGVLPAVSPASVPASAPASSGPSAPYVLVVGEGRQAVGIVVDRVVGLREIVVRPVTDRLVQVPYVSGATELGDGRAVLILDTARIGRGAGRPGGAAAAGGPGSFRPQQEQTLVP